MIAVLFQQPFYKIILICLVHFSNLLMIKKTKLDNFYFLSVHLKKVYMVSDESELHIIFYNGSRHMHDMPQKLTLIESYLVRPITRVSMPSLPDYRVGFRLRDPPLTAIDTP